MPFARPSLTEITDRIRTDMESRLTGGAAVLRRAVIRVISIVYGGAVHLLYGFLDWISRQVFPDTADDAELIRWASLYGIERIPAEFAQGNVTFTGVNGNIIPAGTELQRSDGAVFTTDAEATIVAGTATVAVTADEAGEDGNTDVGAELQLVSPIANIDSTVTVAAGGLAEGTDIEDLEDLRARLMLRIQEPPAGGSETDYEQWALEVAGVTRVWVYPNNLGPGTVVVLFVRDDDASIIPDAGEIAAVQAHIDGLKPVTADVTVDAPTSSSVNFTIDGLTPDTAAIRAAIEAQLEDLFARKSEPGGTIFLSQMREAISLATGEEDHVLVSPNADVTASAGQLKVLGTISYT